MNVLSGATALVEHAGELCEGPCWDERAGTLVWVDILAGAVHTIDPGSGQRSTRHLGMPVGAVAPRRHGGWVAAVERGFLLLDDEWQSVGSVIPAPDQPSDTRFNDGCGDPSGGFWAGTLAYDGTPGRATLYRLDPDGSVEQMLSGVTNSNGMAWSADGTRVYYVDTGRGTLDRFDVDPDTRALAGRTTIVVVPQADGLPDGLTIDAEGCLWLALWGGGCVRRYRHDGVLDAVVELPVALVTSLAFGGSGYDELFITTARQGLTSAELREQPLAGSVFHCRPGVGGLPPLPFAG